VSHVAVSDGAVLVLTGAGWIIALGLFSAWYQPILPTWVKARAMAYYLFAFQGALGIGSLALGGVAQATALDTGLIVLAAGLAVTTAATWRLALPRPGDIDVTLAEAMPLPDVEPTEGPVLSGTWRRTWWDRGRSTSASTLAGPNTINN
jgi:Transmembrane secretion effector